MTTAKKQPTKKKEEGKNEHKIIGGSDAARAFACPMSLVFKREIPEGEPGESAAYGTRAHDIAERVLTGELAAYIRKADRKEVDTNLTTGWQAMKDCDDLEMRNLVKGYCMRVINHVAEIASEGTVEKLAIEKEFLLSEEVGGKADVAILYVDGRKQRRLSIIDLKTGKNIYVATVDEQTGKINTQLSLYLCAAIAHWGKVDFGEVIVYQPRIPDAEGPWRSLELPFDEISKLIKEYKAKAEYSLGHPEEANAGEHCKWCRGSHVCKARLQHIGALVPSGDEDFQIITPDAETPVVFTTLTLEQRINIIKNAPAIKAFLREVEEGVFQDVMAGQEIPGVKLVEGRKTRIWGAGAESSLLAEAKNYGVDFFEPPTLLSPAKLEKALGKKVFRDNFAPLVDYTEPKMKLVIDEDPRPALPTSKEIALEEFSEIEWE